MDEENKCQRCPEKCSYSEHYHARKMMKTSEQKLTTVLHDIKAKFDIATKNKSSFEQKLNSAQDARKLMEQVLKQKIEAIQVQCRELRKVCGGFNLAAELYILVEQLRIEARTLTSLEAQNQADLVIRELTMFCKKLEAEEQNITNVKSEMIVVDTGSGSERAADKFRSNTQNSTQESNRKVSAVQEILDAQLKRKNAPMVTANPIELSMYEPIDEEDQVEPYHKSRQSFFASQQKFTGQRNIQPPEIPQRLPNKSRGGYGSHISTTASTSNRDYGRIYNSQESSIPNVVTPKYELMTIRELVDELRKAIAKNRSKAAIERELRNRAQGITCPMITASDRAMFTRYTNKYSHMEPSDISHQYLRLQQHVYSRLGGDDMNIERITTIPAELLVELAALYTLFSSKNTLTMDDNDREQQHDDYRRESPPRTSGAIRRRQSSESVGQDLGSHQVYAELYSGENTDGPPSYNDAVGPRNEPLPRTQSNSITTTRQAQPRERQVGSKKLLYDYRLY